MELQFKPERLGIIRRLMGLTMKDIEERYKKFTGTINKVDFYRWENGQVSPRSFDKVESLAKCLNIPVGFFYYNEINYEIKNNHVMIFIPETFETLNFSLINTYKNGK